MADLFADALAPPPPPKLGFAGALSTFFGGNPSGAYTEGLNTGSQYRLRSAQTEESLARAEVERAERMRKQQEIDAINKAQSDPNYRGTIADMLATRSNPQQYGLDPLSVQEHGFRSILGDLGAAPEEQFAAGQGVQGRVMPRIETAGGQNYNLATDPNMQAPTMTPLQQADVAATTAQAGQRNRSPASAAGGGWNTVTVGGRRLRERVNPETGEYESEFVTDPQLGSRERTIYQRALTAANLAIPGLANIMNSAASASTGILSGVQGGAGIFSNTKAQLAKALTSEEAKQFDAMMAGIGRQLAVIEGGGLVPSESLTNSFAQLTLQPTDNQLTKLLKLAEMRQSVEYGLQAFLSNEAITGKLRQDIERMADQVQRAVPYTTEDVLELQRSPNPNASLGDIVRQRGLGDPASNSQIQQPQAPAAGQPVQVQTVEEARALPPGTIFITPDGRRKVR